MSPCATCTAHDGDRRGAHAARRRRGRACDLGRLRDGARPLETSWRSAGTDRFDNEIEKAVGSVSKGESRALSTAISVSPGELSTTLFDRLRAASVVLGPGV